MERVGMQRKIHVRLKKGFLKSEYFFNNYANSMYYIFTTVSF